MPIRSVVIIAEFIHNGTSEMHHYIGKYFLPCAKGILMFLGCILLLDQCIGIPSEQERTMSYINLRAQIFGQQLRYELSKEENYREILDNPEALNSFVESFFIKQEKRNSRLGKDYSFSFRIEGTKAFIFCKSPFSRQVCPPCIWVYPINLDVNCD